MSDIQKRPAAAPPGGAMPKVKDALGYLEKVKNKFANKPHVYNQFLDIMKDFKSQNIDTEGVIVRVKTLFKGNRNLILGFNQFLPPGYKIEMPLEPKPSAGGAAQAAAGPAAPPALHQPPYYPPYEQAQPPQRHQPPHPAPAAPGGPGAGAPPPAAAPGGGAGQGAGQGQPGAPGAPKTTIEFNHAVQYVAKIKNRFRDQPQIYAEFLDILHDYQARRTIEDVYKRVQDLFLGQQDLLDEFKYFLPDTSNQMGAGPLPKRVGKMAPQKTKPGKGDKPSLDSGRPLKRGRTPKPGEEPVPGRKLGAGQPSLGGGLSGPAAVAAAKDKAKAAAQRGPPITFPAGSEEEIAVLDRIKGALPKSQFNQVLKLLNLFAQGVLTRQQMVRSIEGILQEKHSDLTERFKNAIEYVEWEENAAMTEAHSSFTAFMTSAALNRCSQPTPSYRTLPDDLPVPGCSGRTTLSEEVLNDRVISLPTGSEEGSSFKSTRKNIYEENLFRCEDERFELDMVIENNASTIKMLEPLAKEIAAMSAEQAKTFRLGKALHILHLRAIQRLYGDQGHEFCELLKRSPATAVPVVLARCKQKDEEWRKLRSEMKTTWRKVTEQNYYRSLDHRSFYFKQEDKRRLMGKNLVSNLREIHNQVFGDSKGKDVYESEAMRHLEQEGPIYTYCLRFKFPEVSLHEDLYGIVMHVAESQCTEQEQRKIKAFFDTFIHPYFSVNLEGRLLSHPAAKPHARLRKRPELDSPSDAEDNESAGEEKKEEPERERDEFEDEDIDMDSAPLDSYGAHPHSHSKPSASPTPSAPSEPSMAANSAAASAFEHEASSVVPGGGDVKPLLIAMSTWEAEQKVAPVRKHSRPSKLFFANNALYIFFRLHQFLYSRLLKGKQLAFKHKLKSASAANKNKRGKKKKRRPDPTTKEEAHEQFKALLYELIDGDIDSSRYEDELRSLLGASSFVLYTLDKLVFHLIKSLQAIVNNENCMKLLSLFRYEHERWQLMEHTEERSAQHLRMYHNNSANLIGDDNCTQIEYFEDTHELCFGLADGPSSFESKAANAEESAYVHAYLQPIEDGEQAYKNLIPTHVKPFLKRNVTHSPFTRESAMANVSMVNKLQSMISTRSYKIHYGDDTHDTFVRLVPKKRALLRKALAAKSEEEVEMPPTARTLRGQAVYKQRFLSLNPGWDEAHDHDHLELSRTPSPPVKQEKDFGALDAAAAGAVAELARGRPQRSSRRTANANSDVEAGDDSSVAGDREMASSPNEAAAAGAEAISAMAQAAALDAEMDADAGDGDGLDDDGADGGDGDGGDVVGDMETDEQMPEGAQ